MNWVDLLLMMVVLLSIVSGVQRGFVMASWHLLSWIGSLVLGFLSYKPLSEVLLLAFPALGFWAVPLMFILSIVLARLVLDQFGAHLLDLLPEGSHEHPINKVLGILPGFINGLIWAILLASLLLFVPLSTGLSTQTQQSRLVAPLLAQAEWIQNQLHPVFSEAFKRGLASTGPVNAKEESVSLPYTVKTPKVRVDLTAQMLVLINRERAQAGLPALQADAALRQVALKHSADMFARGYFSHVNPEGRTPFNRIDEAGLRYLSAGENLALAQTLQIAHQGLMNSPGHRANIMNQSFGRVGIGILDGGIYGLMITQVFRN